MQADTKQLRSIFLTFFERRARHAAALQDVRFGEEGYFRRAVDVVSNFLTQEANSPYPQGDVGREFLEGWVEQLIEAARVDYCSYQALTYCSQVHKDDERLPALKAWRNNHYLGIYKAPRRPPGRHEAGNYFRDRAICSAISDLVGIGFQATRNRALAGASACDVVTDALPSIGQTISYGAVEKIWVSRGRLTLGPAAVDMVSALADLIKERLSETKPG